MNTIRTGRHLITGAMALGLALLTPSLWAEDTTAEFFTSDQLPYEERDPTPTPLAAAKLDLSQLPEIEDVDLLAISDEIKSLLDAKIRPIENETQRAEELHRLLFKPFFLGIRYDYEQTHTAQGTFDHGAGNCLSHASLYVAAARYVGLKAKFQTVTVPREWMDMKDFYVVPGHINVGITTRGHATLTVEFTDVYSAYHTQNMKTEAISDRQALAEYYNNKGMEHMGKQDYLSAIAYMRKSVDTYKRMGFVWSNLGVAYKINGHLALAEDAYKRGLKYEKHNLSIINNIYILYRQKGENEKADKLAKKVERYSKKNPYYLEKLARSDMSLGNQRNAISLLKRAIALKPEEPRFHFSLSLAYYDLGEMDKSIAALEKAQSLSETYDDYLRYQAKLNVLKHYQARL